MAVGSRLLRVRSGEGRVAALVAGLTFVATVATTVGESGVDALFFDRIGPQALPVMYVIQGVATLAVTVGLTDLLGTLGYRRAYLGIPLALAALVLVERAIVASNALWIYRAMWVTVTVASVVMTVALWGTAGAVVDARQAKR